MKQAKKEQKMTNILTIPFVGQGETRSSLLSESLSTWFKNLVSRQTVTIGEEEMLLASPSFDEYVKSVTTDFIKNKANLKKYPKMNEDDWK